MTLTPEIKDVLSDAIKQSVSEGFAAGYKKGKSDALFTIRFQLAVILLQCVLMLWTIHNARSMSEEAIRAVRAAGDELQRGRLEIRK